MRSLSLLLLAAAAVAAAATPALGERRSCTACLQLPQAPSLVR